MLALIYLLSCYQLCHKSLSFLLWSCHDTGSSMAPLYLLGQDKQNEVQHDFSGHVMLLVLTLASSDVVGIVNGTIAFVISR